MHSPCCSNTGSELHLLERLEGERPLSRVLVSTQCLWVQLVWDGHSRLSSKSSSLPLGHSAGLGFPASLSASCDHVASIFPA